MNRLVLVLLVGLSGCGGHSIRNIDKPAPEAYEMWVKPGASPLDVKKALLECGEPHPAPTIAIYEAIGLKTQDDQTQFSFMVDACMEKAGFIPRWDNLEQSCKLYPKYRNYPACQPNAQIPTPSVERRLNSWHCKLKTDRDYCRKHAFTPTACDDPQKDYDNPPPECRR
jgi:hypothetical protein